MQNSFDAQKQMLESYWLQQILLRSKRQIIMASLFTFGILSTANVYAVSNDLNGNAVVDNAHSSQQSLKKVTGHVIDNNGEPIIGASVKVKGTTNGTITDMDGNFTLSTNSDNSTIEISFVGYQSKTIKIKGNDFFKISLEEDSKLLDEVVVVGYGTQKRLTMTSAVATVKGDNIKAPVANVSNQLGGQIPGIITRQSSGEPGKDAATVLLRGTTPLVLIDGIERAWEKTNQEDIESISVLKDASAVAPYGLKGANGVILITTKRGQKGKLSLSYDASFGTQRPMNTPEFMNSYDGLSFYNEALKMDGRSNEIISDDILQKYKVGSDEYPNTDWMGEYLKSSTTTRHNISLSGGNDLVTAFVSMGYYYQGSMMGSGNDYDRYNLRSNVDFHPTKITDVAVDINLAYDNKKSHYIDGANLMEYLYRLPPTEPNTINGLPAFQSQGWSLYQMVHSGADNSDQNNFQDINLTINQKLPFLKGLSVKGVFSYDRQIYDYKYWVYPYIAYRLNAGEVEEITGGSAKPGLSVGNRQWTSYTMQGHINYSNTFGKHSVGALAVYERRWGGKTDFAASRTQYDFLIPELNMGSVDKQYQSNSGYSTKYAQQGVVFRGNYSYDQKYMLEVAGRYDETYQYAPGNRGAFFPSISLGWRISEESFIKDKLPMISNLKLRASYGKSGNPVGDAFSYLSKYNIGTGAVFGKDPVQTQSLQEGVEPNVDLTWETVWKSNIGLDVNLWNDLLVSEIDVYRDKRNDKILSPNAVVSSEYGIGLANENAGKEERYGVDLALHNTVKFGFGLKMTNSFSFSFTKDKQLELREAAGTLNNPRKRQTGGPSGRTWGYKAAGLFKDQQDIDNWAYQGVNVLPGDVKYVDINGDGKIDSNDQVVIGLNQTPQIMWGYNLRLAYKRFDLSMLIQGTGNSDYYLGSNGDRGVRYPFNDGIHPRKEHLDSWTESNPNPNAKYPRLSATKRTQNYEVSDFWMVNTAYVKLKSLQLGYNFDPKFIKKAYMQNLRIYADFYNLWTIFSNMSKDFDSENQAFNSYPQQFISSFGVSITF